MILSAGSFAVAAAMTFGAAFVRGLTGFGMAILLVPLLGLLIAPAEAVIVGILLQFLIGPAGWRQIAADAHRPSVAVIAGVAMVTTPIGLWLLTRTAPDVARVAIAAIACLAFAAVLVPPRLVRTPGRGVQVATGAVSGVMTGFAAMPGPPVIPYYLMQALPPATARASMMAIFFATAIAGTLAALAAGRATGALWILAIALYLPMWIGNRVGARAFGRVSPRVWRTVVATVLGVASLLAVARLIG